MRAKGYEPGTKFVHLTAMTADSVVAETLALEEEAPVLLIERVRTVEQSPIVLFKTYIAVNEALPTNEAAYEDSLYALIESRLGRKFTRVLETFETTSATKEVAEQ